MSTITITQTIEIVIDINDIQNSNQLEQAGYCEGQSTNVGIAFNEDGTEREWVHIVEWLHAEYDAPQVFEVVADSFYYFFDDFDDAKEAALEIVHTLEGRCMKPTWTVVI